MTAPAPGTDLTLSGALLTATRRQRDPLTGHPWVTGAFTGGGAAIALKIWAQQNTFLSQLRFTAVRLLVGYHPPAGLTAHLVALISEYEEEKKMCAEILRILGASPAAGPWLGCDGYGSYLVRCAVGGLREGLTAAAFAAAADLDAFTAIRAADPPPDSRWRPLVSEWPGPRFRDAVEGLRAGLDQEIPAGEPLKLAVPALLPIAEQTLRFRAQHLYSCWYGDGWQPW